MLLVTLRSSHLPMPGVLAAYVGSRTGGIVLYLAWRLSSLLSSLGSSLVLACWGCVPCTLEGILFIPEVKTEIRIEVNVDFTIACWGSRTMVML